MEAMATKPRKVRQRATVKVFRYDPENNPEPYYDTYDVPFDPQNSVLQVLTDIRGQCFPEGHRQVFHMLSALDNFTQSVAGARGRFAIGDDTGHEPGKRRSGVPSMGNYWEQ